MLKNIPRFYWLKRPTISDLWPLWAFLAFGLSLKSQNHFTVLSWEEMDGGPSTSLLPRSRRLFMVVHCHCLPGEPCKLATTLSRSRFWITGDCSPTFSCRRIFLLNGRRKMSTAATSTKLAKVVQSCRVPLVQSLEACQFLMDPGTGWGASPLCQFCQQTRFPTFISPVRWSNHYLEAWISRRFVLVQWNVALFAPTFDFSQTWRPKFFSFFSAVMGHRLHCICGCHPGVSMLLLRLQKMDIQEEKQEEGQRQGQKRHQHEGRHWRSQNWGRNFPSSHANTCWPNTTQL